MSDSPQRTYEVLFYDGWSFVPAYYLVGTVEGESPEQALTSSLEEMTQEVRRVLGLSAQDLSDEEIQETLYVLREGGLIPARNLGRT
ncbi:MAG TPA: hypothetical protein EYP85_15965 [Armatimonadetes bacterium]|nr:hypothetical protein [Armatimonadota bacterium]